MSEEKIALFIKKLRKENNLTQKQLAEKLNVTYQAVSKWENSKSIPDIETLRLISKKFDIPMSHIFEEEQSSFNIYIHLIVLFVVGAIIYLFINTNSYSFNEIISDCANFNINGVVAYNKDKTSLYISNIDFCGEKNETIYESIECNLLEQVDEVSHVINTCGKKENSNLEEYLNDLKFKVDDFTVSCKSFKTAYVFLEIKGIKDETETVFKIPIKLDDSCINNNSTNS